jgi:flagellar protein FlaG
MNIGNLLSNSKLLQRSENNLSISADRERTNAVVNYSHLQKEDSNENELGVKQIKEITESLNKFIEPTKTSLKFEFHEKLEEYYISIINQDTKEVIKEIPPKKMLDMYAAMAEFMGIIVDKRI